MSTAFTGLSRTFETPIRTGEYSLLPFKFMPFDDKRYVAVNAGGDHILTKRDTLQALIEHKLSPNDAEFDEFEGRQFITDRKSVV